ncbi:hypothetical protein Lal_00010256 [Lupinus albus]|nr:hypothetical protein Lal_00010256 [Lupinus albus]
MRLSATLSTVNRWSLPISGGIVPEILFPTRSMIRRKDRLFRLASEVDIGDAAGLLVAADAVPFVAAIGAGP